MSTYIDTMELDQMAAPGGGGADAPVRTAPRRRTAVAVALTLLIAGFAVAATTWAPLRRQVLLSVSQRPTSYTEIYFTDFSALPDVVPVGTTYQVGVTLVGHGDAPTSEAVTSVLEARGRSVAGSEKTVQLGPGGRAQLTIPFTPSAKSTVYTLVISLPSGQDIQWRVLSG